MPKIDSSLSFFLYLLHIFLITSSTSLLLQVNGKKEKYCFYKETKEIDSLQINYIVSSDNKNERLDVKLSDASGKILYSNTGKSSGEFKSEMMEPGNFTLCFKPLSRASYHLTFEFFSFVETGVIKSPVQDIEVKEMSKGVNDLKDLFHQFERNYRFIVDRRSRHTIILDDILESIKKLTILKIATLTILSLFQVFIIKRFFGPDKVVKSVKGAFKEGL